MRRKIPAWIRTHKSLSLLRGIGDATLYWAEESWEHAIELFIHLDKIMLELCGQSESVEGPGEESVEKWRELRMDFVKQTNWFISTPKHLQLAEGYFDALQGHGPLPESRFQSKSQRSNFHLEVTNVQDASATALTSDSTLQATGTFRVRVVAKRFFTSVVSIFS